jgi:hypothetical protein
MNELTQTLNVRKSLQETTKKVYTNAYKKLRAITNKDIIDLSEEEIIDFIFEKSALKISAKLTLLNIAIVIREVYDLPIEELKSVRANSSDELKVHSVLKNEDLKHDLPSYAELLDFVNNLYDKGEYVKYIINYLILTFSVRNMDLNLQIVKSSKGITNKDNWIVLNKNNADYIRYIYKTADTHDAKINQITSKPFLTALREVLGENDSVFLLKKQDGERINPITLNNVISRMTFKNEVFKNGIGQANILKIILNEKTDIKTFLKVSKNRGTSIAVLNSNYNLNLPDDVVEPKTTALKITALKRIPAGETGQEKKKLNLKMKAEELGL